jgi:hypothetical protein
MIKRIVAILLLSVFTLTAVGVEVRKLYCDGKLSNIGSDVKPCCKAKACCEIESDFYSLTGSYESSDFTFEFRSLIASLVFYYSPSLVFDFPPVVIIKPIANPPDEGRLYSCIPIRILYCSYQI